MTRSLAGAEELTLESDIGFADLLSPFPLEEFFTNYYDQRHVYATAHKEKFRGICSLEQFRDLISRGTPWRSKRPPEVYYCGRMIAFEDLQYEFSSMDGYSCIRPRSERLESVFQKGSSIVCYSMHDFVVPLDDVCRVVANTLNAEVEGHLVYSQRSKQGLAPHYDSTDVFVLQLEGEKVWNLWNHRVKNPIGGLGERVDLDPEAKFEQAYLSPGDLLYIPRGSFHDAIAVSNESLHASIVAKVPTNFDFLSSLLTYALASDEIRGYLPCLDRSVSDSSTEQSITHLLATLDSLARSPQLMEDFLTEVNLKARKG